MWSMKNIFTPHKSLHFRIIPLDYFSICASYISISFAHINTCDFRFSDYCTNGIYLRLSYIHKGALNAQLKKKNLSKSK